MRAFRYGGVFVDALCLTRMRLMIIDPTLPGRPHRLRQRNAGPDLIRAGT